jgi:glutamine amidotransferase
VIAIVDYGVGNIRAIVNIYKRLNIAVQVARAAEEVMEAERLILPGVGAFDWAMARLNKSGMRAALDDAVLSKGKPVLGICVGMQMLANRSDEGTLTGLGWIDGEVKKFSGAAHSERTYLPHMGWNDVEPRHQECLFRNIGTTGRFYFLHSYYFMPKDRNVILGVTEYGGAFASSVRFGSIYGVQFHPEKSHHWGIQVLKNFAAM